jgi:hypothetical protein
MYKSILAYKHNMPPTCLGHSCELPQGGNVSIQPSFVIHLLEDDHNSDHDI